MERFHTSLTWSLVSLAIFFSTGSFASASLSHSGSFASSSAQYLSVPSNSGTALDLTGPFTILSWVKFSGLPTLGQLNSFVSKGNNTNANSSYEAFALTNVTGTPQIYVQLMHDSGTQTQKYFDWTPSADIWYQVALVYTASGSNDILFYVDGIQVGSAQSSGFTSLNSNPSPFYVGVSGQSPTPVLPMNGNMAQVAIFNSALSSSTIASYYCYELTGSENSIVGLWNLNGTTTDSTSNGNDLTAHNGLTFTRDVPPCLGLSTSTIVRKMNTQRVSNTSTLQNDSQLVMALGANQVYTVRGVIFASATTSTVTPDIIAGFTGPADSVITIGADKTMLVGGEVSPRFVLPSDVPRAIRINGTVTTGAIAGNLQFKWAQSTPASAPTSVLRGSYLSIQKAR